MLVLCLDSYFSVVKGESSPAYVCHHVSQTSGRDPGALVRVGQGFALPPMPCPAEEEEGKQKHEQGMQEVSEQQLIWLRILIMAAGFVQSACILTWHASRFWSEMQTRICIQLT